MFGINRKEWKRKLSSLLAASLLAGSMMISGQPAPAYAEAAGPANSDEVPGLLITELVPDSTDINDADAYEFIEVYNNTNQPMDIKDYMLIYRYPDTKASDRYWHPYSSVVIPPKGVLVLWGMVGTNEDLTVADFNANYGTSLVENETIVRIPSGMHDARDREIVLATNTGQDLVVARYNQGYIATSPDKGVHYKTPDPGSIRMKLVSPYADTATPGTISPEQVPAQPNIVVPDHVAPVITDLTTSDTPDLMKPMEFVAEAGDDRLLTSVSLKYKAAYDPDFKTAYIIQGEDGLFRHSLELEQWYGSPTLTYYFEATDGMNVVATAEKTLSLAGNPDALEWNVKDGDVLTGDKVIFANELPEHLTLMIDGQSVQETDEEKTLSSMPYFVFEANGINAGQNAITVGNEVVQIIPLNTTGFATVRVPMSPRLFKYGQDNPIAIRAGSTKRPYFEEAPEPGLDDYDIRNVRLEFADGTVLRDPQYADPKLVLDMGDNGRFLPVVYFNFAIPESQWEKRPVRKAMDKPAYFVFEVDGIDKGQNFITMGEQELKLIPLGTKGFPTVVVPISPELLQYGERNPIAIRAGSVNRAYYEHAPEGGLDDFDIRNVRLILADGTELRDPQYEDPSLVLDMGDSGRFLPIVYFNFTIPENKWNASSYRWNTASMPDGAHQVKVKNHNGLEHSVNVTTDNSGPVITTNMAEGQTYKGEFTIEAQASDVSGVSSFTAVLDGKEIQVPYLISSGLIDPGTHELLLSATDKVGQTTAQTINFSTPEEHPYSPELLAPADGEGNVGTTAELQVKVGDPSNDPMQVGFYRGNRIDGASEAMNIYVNSVDREPPLTIVSPGETLLSAEEKAKLAASDDEYVTTDSITQFPYHRFEVEVGDDIGAGDSIELQWEGHSLEGRKVTMYAWNYEVNEWQPLASLIAQSDDDFTLAATIDAGPYVNEGRIQAMVQDLIPSADEYDYTFVVLPDTQMYAEIYPKYFQSQVEWIRDNKDAMKIRYVAHVGDIVNTTPNLDQWDRADRFMKVLEDAGIPYGVAAGNHDVFDGGVTGGEPDYSLFGKYFGADRFKDTPYYGESYENNRAHYDLISAAGNDYIIAYVGWGLNDSVLKWTDQAIKKFPERKAVIVTHEYLTAKAERSATGNRLYNEVVVPNPNVELVISGHFTGSAVRSDEIDDDGDGIADRTVHQMLADYQGIGEGGSGYLKLLHFDTKNKLVYVNTYSPELDDYNHYEPEKDEWTLAMELTPQMKRVGTDSFVVQVFTDEQIGSIVQAESGDSVQMTWNGLSGDQVYYWYVIAEDQFGGRTVSDLWNFRTKAVLAAPTGLRAHNITATGLDLSWDKVDLRDGAAVTYSVYADNRWITTVTESVYRVEGLEPDTEYRFTVVAEHPTLGVSQPSEPLVVTTSRMDLAVLESILNQYIASGEVSDPLANQLSQSIKQARHQWDKGSADQAVKKLEDFQKHLNKKSMAPYVTEAAKRTLHSRSQSLIQVWGS